MKISELNGKRVAILGYGREGKATEAALKKYAPEAIVEIRDQSMSEDYLEGLEQCDVLIKSPGLPPSLIPIEVTSKVTNSTQIFLDTVASKGSLVIGITGTKGKSTTSALLAHILQSTGKDCHLVGNIGIPALDYLDNAKENTIFVQEMSSYQLHDLTSSPPIAVILNLFQEHLNYHGTMEEYRRCKEQIVRYQSSDDCVFYSSDSMEATEMGQVSGSKKYPVSENKCPIEISETNLLGEHNRINIAVAHSIALHLDIDDLASIEAIKAFKGLPHRLQSLGIHHDIHWIDDAICTTPESTIAALEAIPETTTLILGGQDRKQDFSLLLEPLKASRVSNIILIGETAERIQKELSELDCTFQNATDMSSVISIANRLSLTANRSTVLLSTAAPSYDMFRDYEDKGDQFQSAIRQLIADR